jgi:type IV secretory pathway VirJ component
MGRVIRSGLVMLAVGAVLSSSTGPLFQTTDSLTIRGKSQSLRLYGQRGSPPVIVSSGDGGWIHLGPHVAETLAAHDFFVVGVDVKAYLESFTLGSTTLRPEDEPRDYAALAAYAAKGSSQKPILIGVSEGAGLSVLAATDPSTKAAIAGVIGLGLPDLNELGWRWRDSLIYVTHGVPKEPTFSTQAIVDRVAPTPLAAIHSTQDEFVPLAEAQRIIESARDPKRLWVIKASDHRFSDNLAEFDQRLLEAIAWVRSSAKE